MSGKPNSSRVRSLLRHDGGPKRGIAGVIALCVAGAIAAGALVASAAVPTFPDNILVFPNRDFVTVEGYAGHKGETATLEITRPGKGVIGSAQGVVSGGDVAFEVNHPGGVCWGKGTSLQVTPDIQPGDVATIKFGATAAGDTTVQDAYVKTVTYDPAVDPKKVVVEGPTHLDAAISTNIEQRTVNPALVAMIGKRDVRAVPGDLVAAARTGPDGSYSSGLTVNPNGTFTATYLFDSAAVAETVAHGGGERLLSWQQLDGAGNRQGVTIAELGELGGPGMGGCPNGPSAQVPPTPRSVAIVRSMDKTSLQVNWAAVTAVPAADPVDGYSVDLIATTASAAGEHQQRGIRTPTSVTKATFNGLDPAETYTVEVRSMAAGHMSDAGVPSPPPDTTLPTITMSPKPSADNSPVAAPDGVTLSSSNGGQIYYTTDSSAPINGDMPSDKAKLYTDPIPVPGPGTTEIRAAAFDNAGNNVEVQGFYKPPDPIAPAPAPATAPAPPAGLTGTGGLHKVSLTWTAGDATVTDYRVVAYKGATIVSTTPATTNGVTVDGLTAGDSYTFTVAAKNTTGWSTESAPTSPIQATDAVTVGSARWKLGDFRVTGTGTDIGGVTVYDAATDKPIPGATATMTAAVAPATGTTFDIRLRNAQAPNPKPAKVYVKSSLGGVSAPFAVIG